MLLRPGLLLLLQLSLLQVEGTHDVELHQHLGSQRRAGALMRSRLCSGQGIP